MTTTPEPDTVRGFIQARMTSKRLPGKTLAPLGGLPILHHVVERVRKALPKPEQTLVLTSDHPSDDPVKTYAERLEVPVVRGPLADVARRFRKALKSHPTTWFVRICADSPLISPGLIQKIVERHEQPDVDLVTNREPQTFPTGQTVELVRASTFLDLDPSEMSDHEKEHVTQAFYNRPDDFTIQNVTSGNPRLRRLDLAVDTLDDLRRLEGLIESGVDPWPDLDAPEKPASTG